MFESAELGHKIDKETFKKEVPKLRAALLDVQDDLLQKKEFPVVILISGVDGSGKGGVRRNTRDLRHFREVRRDVRGDGQGGVRHERPPLRARLADGDAPARLP